MNTGCGTLIFVFIVLAAMGKLFSHDSSSNIKDPATGLHAASVRPHSGQPRDVSSGGKPQVAVKSPLIQASPDAEITWQSALMELKGWIDRQARDAEQTGGMLVARPQSNASPASEILAKMGEEARMAVTERFSEVVTQSIAPSAITTPKSESAPVRPLASKPPTPATPPLVASKSASSGARTAVEGRDAVFNNPWNHAVAPVERYLKQHVHDAASIELLEWGQVEVTPHGYQVRCVYKSKNVLGKMATQSRLFVMDREGKVIDIRD